MFKNRQHSSRMRTDLQHVFASHIGIDIRIEIGTEIGIEIERSTPLPVKDLQRVREVSVSVAVFSFCFQRNFILIENPCPPVHDTWFSVDRRGLPSAHLYMTLGIPFWAKIRAHLCMTLDFWFTDWANPVSTYTWHWVYTLLEQKNLCPPVHDTWFFC